MSRPYIALALAGLLLCACGVPGDKPDENRQIEVSVVSESSMTLWQDTSGEIEEISALQPEDLTARLSSLEGLSSLDSKSRMTYTLLADTPDAITVTALIGEEEGPTVYIVGGIHGDEPAGWLAGVLLSRAYIKAGRVYVLSPANAYGASRLERNTKDGRDLNRCFPGDAGGADAYRIAAAIYEDVAQKRPDLLLDLHEARPRTGEVDSLENTIICHSLVGIDSLVLDMLISSEAGELCSAELSLYASPPKGSINRTVSEELGIPVITVETGRSQPLKVRVADQLDLTGYVLQWYGMCR